MPLSPPTQHHVDGFYPVYHEAEEVPSPEALDPNAGLLALLGAERQKLRRTLQRHGQPVGAHRRVVGLDGAMPAGDVGLSSTAVGHEAAPVSGINLTVPMHMAPEAPAVSAASPETCKAEGGAAYTASSSSVPASSHLESLSYMDELGTNDGWKEMLE